MSYNHHNQNQGYVPSYTSRNTGAAYMARRGWDGSGSGNGSEANTQISFSSKSSSKRIYITLFIMIVLLLLAAIVIIILFATGVFTGADPLQNPTNSPLVNPTFRPPINNQPTMGPPIFSQNQTYSGSFTILRQGSTVYDMKNTNIYYSAMNLIQNALDNVFVTSSLQPYAAHATLTDLQNRGDDLAVLFRVNLLGGGSVDQNTVAGVIRSNLNQLQSQLGGNAQIDPNTIFVFRLFT